MNTEELQRVYGDSHTLDRPTDEDSAEFHQPVAQPESRSPLDHPRVVEEGDSQGWGS